MASIVKRRSMRGCLWDISRDERTRRGRISLRLYLCSGAINVLSIVGPIQDFETATKVLFETLYNLAVAYFGLQMSALPPPSSTVRSIQETPLQHRNTPLIAGSWSEEQKARLETATQDAMELAYYAFYNGDPDVFDIYFEKKDLEKVLSVFEQIIEYKENLLPRFSEAGNPLLGNIQIVPDYLDAHGVRGCDGSTLALIRDWDTDYPKIIVCPEAFTHGSLHDASREEKCTCVALNGGRASWRMNVLGATLLHEYTHWTKLMQFAGSPLQGSFLDDGTGVYHAQTIDKGQALTNADSYTWFALENYWTTFCKKSFGSATEDDAKDPYVKGTTGVKPPDAV